jgi:hypothetical protein
MGNAEKCLNLFEEALQIVSNYQEDSPDKELLIATANFNLVGLNKMLFCVA